MITYRLFKAFGDVFTVNKVEPGLPDVSIPFDPANTDYQAYLAWLEEGNTPLPADEPAQGE